MLNYLNVNKLLLKFYFKSTSFGNPGLSIEKNSKESVTSIFNDLLNSCKKILKFSEEKFFDELCFKYNSLYSFKLFANQLIMLCELNLFKI